MGWGWLFSLLLAGPADAQQVCAPVPAYMPCDLVFELNESEAGAHGNPYATVELRAEVRSPRAKTFLAHAFWDGGRRLVIRVAPTDPGTWDFRVTSNIARFNGQMGKLQATDSPDPGFLLPANLHHWMYSESRKQHLWMGDADDFGAIDESQFAGRLESRQRQKFNHLRALVLPDSAFPAPDRPNVAWFQQLDRRLQAMSQKTMFADLILARDGAQVQKLFPTWQDRQRFVRYLVARYSAFHVTWNMLARFDATEDGRAVAKEMGELVAKTDPYSHPRSTGTGSTSGPLQPDGWQRFITHQTTDDAVGSIEHQIFATPFVNAGFVNPNASPEEFRKRLWNAAMNGQYPSASGLDEEKAKTMSAWFDFFARTRYWELEPFFDLDGGRALALPGIEYIVYIEKPGPVEIMVEKHDYDVFWFNPITGELTKEKKEFKGDRYSGEPPDKSHDWVLHLSREGRKEGMLRSYKYESRPNLMQEIEVSPQKMPFELLEPSVDRLSLAKPPKYAVKLKRETRATRSMTYLWTGEVATEGRGYRVVGTGAEGVFRIPATLARQFPAVFNVRLYAMNAAGKVYALDRVYRLVE